MSFFDDIGGAVTSAFQGVQGLLPTIGSGLSLATGNPLWAVGGKMLGGGQQSAVPDGMYSSAMGYLGQQQTNQDNMAIHRADNDFNAGQSVLQRNFSADQAQKQMDYQTRMSNTSWQRGVKDMQAAGLSPMLAYMKGGASAPVGAMGSSSAASAASPISMSNSVQAGYNSANTAADSSLKEASYDLTEEQMVVASQTGYKIAAEIRNLDSDNERIKRAAELLQAQYGNTGANTAVAKATADKIVEETKLVKQDVSAGAAFGGIGKDAGQLRPFIELLWNAFRRH